MSENKCPLSYLPCGSARYSSAGLRGLSRSLTDLADLPFSAREQRTEAAGRMQRMSIQGVQPKLGAILNVRKNAFELADSGGTFIIKPQHDAFEQVPENEDLTMRMASVGGIETPWHGLIWSSDGSLSYIIRRFDRLGKGEKLAVEDFAQLAGKTRETKYDFTMERMVGILEKNCSFPAVEKERFFRLFLFCFLTGNEDMHLKNFSLITRASRVELAPAYDLLNSTIVLGKTAEETALLLAGKRSNLRRRELFDYFGLEKLKLSAAVAEGVLTDFEKAMPTWMALIEQSFLNEKMKSAYSKVLAARWKRLQKS